MKLHIVNHPLVSNALHYLRDKNTPSSLFKHYCHLVTIPVIIAATESLETINTEVETPLEQTPTEQIKTMPVFVPILRAGLGMLKVAQEIFPESEVGHIGLERNEKTAEARTYYQKLPSLEGKPVIVLDPMLATGGSASHALDYIKKDSNPGRITLACIVAAPEGVDFISRAHPNVKIVTAAVDRELNAIKYILPGLGDFGDRYFNS
jgi:uracil phosphoribosyltransferase